MRDNNRTPTDVCGEATVLSLSKFRSNVKTISAAKVRRESLSCSSTMLVKLKSLLFFCLVISTLEPCEFQTTTRNENI